MMELSRRVRVWACALVAVMAVPGVALAQIGKDEKPVVELTTRLAPPNGQQSAQLLITAKIAQGWHIYSLTTPEGGPLPTIIKLDAANTHKLAGDPKPDKAPTKKHEEAFDDLPFVEYHEGTVTWQAPLEVAAGVNLATLKVTGMFRYQACDVKSCLPPKIVKFTAMAPGARAEAQPKVIVDDQVQLAAAQAETPATATPPVEAPAVEKLPVQTPAVQAPAGGLESGRSKELIGDLLPRTSLPAASADPGFRAPRTNTTLRGFIEPAVAQPGDTVTLSLTAEPNAEKHYHVYELRGQPRAAGETGNQPTLLVVTDAGGFKQGQATASGTPQQLSAEQVAGGELPYYESPVTWTVQFTVPADAPVGERQIVGLLGYQSCSTSCDPPAAVEFKAALTVAAARGTGRVPLAYKRAPYSAVSELAGNKAPGTVFEIVFLKVGEPATAKAAPSKTANPPKLAETPVAAAADPLSILVTLGMAFLGGLILNVMPCVLPVIGLKILSFVEQAGENRMKVFTLNLWYTGGVLFVFMVLAALAAFTGLAWGQQNNVDEFNITMAAVVFVFALSLLGIWEIPVPGFVGSSEGMQNLAAQEGAAGAFSKGILTTLLATPCSGPFLGVVFAWAAQQPAYLTFATFFCTGLGMASPYLLIGAFPRLIRFLPKPGAWMDTFKQAMGFVLLGTVAYMLTYIKWALVAPTVAFLIALWAACWWIGRTPVYADLGAKFRAWAFGGAFAAMVWSVSFQWLADIQQYRFDEEVDRQIAKYEEKMEKLSPWQRLVEQRRVKLEKLPGHILPFQAFTASRLATLREHNVTVLLDFTASWCQQCQLNKKTALNTLKTREVVEKNDVFTLIVDFTQPNPEGEALMDELQSESIPFYAVYPPGGGKPIILRDVITASQVAGALKEAGPSQQLPEETPAAVTQADAKKSGRAM